MSKSINIRDLDSVNEFGDRVANYLFPQVRFDVEGGASLDDMYATLLRNMGKKKMVSRKDAKWAAFVTCVAIALKIQAEEEAGMFAT